jgi:hypothetical protein
MLNTIGNLSHKLSHNRQKQFINGTFKDRPDDSCDMLDKTKDCPGQKKQKDFNSINPFNMRFQNNEFFKKELNNEVLQNLPLVKRDNLRKVGKSISSSTTEAQNRTLDVIPKFKNLQKVFYKRLRYIQNFKIKGPSIDVSELDASSNSKQEISSKRVESGFMDRLILKYKQRKGFNDHGQWDATHGNQKSAFGDYLKNILNKSNGGNASGQEGGYNALRIDFKNRERVDKKIITEESHLRLHFVRVQDEILANKNTLKTLLSKNQKLKETIFVKRKELLELNKLRTKKTPNTFNLAVPDTPLRNLIEEKCGSRRRSSHRLSSSHFITPIMLRLNSSNN